MSDTNTVHVVGGGLAGLTAASFVARAGFPVVVHESSGVAGGRARTAERDGYRFNLGPHALYVGGAGSAILGELGIRPTGAKPDVNGGAVIDGHCHPGPFSTTGLLRSRLLGRRDKLALGRVLGQLGRLDATAHRQRSVGEWIDGVVKGERAQAVLHTLVRLATYSNAPDELSAQVAIEQMQLGIKPGVFYLDDGWSQLIDGLLAQPGVQITPRSRVTELPDAAAVIVATGDPASSGQLVGRRFEAGPPAEAACLDLGLDGEPPWSFALGLDTPMYASKHSIGARHAPDGGSTLALAEYLTTDQEPSRERLHAFARVLGVQEERIVAQRYLHRMTACSAIATAAMGGYAGRPDVSVPEAPGVFVAGDWVGPVGHLADASIASGKAAALAAVAHLSTRSVPA